MADVQIPPEVLESLDRASESPGLEAAFPDQVEGVSEQDLRELGDASNHDELEGLEETLPDAPDRDDEEIADDADADPGFEEADPEEIGQEAASAGYADESGKLFIGKQFTLRQLARWLAAQNIGAQPYNGIGIHHTWRPTGRDFVGTRTVKAIFDFYARPESQGGRGWTPGKGPHLWLYGGDNPNYHPGKVLVVVGTHPRHDGIGIKGRNHRWLHIECFGDFDAQRMPEGCVRGYRALLEILSRRRNQPVRINHGPSMDGPTTWQGALFHRDARTNPKSCPGNTTTHDWFDDAMTR